jgi:hypothetical protein
MQKRENYLEQLNSIEINFFEENNFAMDEYEVLMMKESNENKIKIKFENTLKDLINMYNVNNKNINDSKGIKL